MWCHPRASVRHGLCHLQVNQFYFNLGDDRQEAGPLNVSFLLRLMAEASGCQSHQRKLFSCPVMSYCLRHHGLQHARLPCPSLTPGACLNSCLWNW